MNVKLLLMKNIFTIEKNKKNSKGVIETDVSFKKLLGIPI